MAMTTPRTRETAPHCREDIVFCVECDAEVLSPFTPKGSAVETTRLAVLQQIVRTIALAKHWLGGEHRFGLVTLEDEAKWLLAPTKDLVLFLETLYAEGRKVNQSFPPLDIASVLTTIEAHVPLPDVKPDEAPASVVRAILLYSRSNTVPTCSLSADELAARYGARHLYLDALYLHAPPSASNRVQDIYDVITSISLAKPAYVFESASNARRLYKRAGMLIAHPCQRDEQFSQSASVAPPTAPVVATATSGTTTRS